jgi:hypothetical protein
VSSHHRISLAPAKENKIVAIPSKEDVKKQLSDLGPQQQNRMKEITGTTNPTLGFDLFLRCESAIPETGGTWESYKSDLVTQTMEELKPQNALEGMLCSQLAALHFQGMRYLKRAEMAEMRCQQDPDLNNAIKLLRLQHETIETLMKLRRNGEQKVIVQYVNVNKGGKAIVGGQVIAREGRGEEKNNEVPYGQT